MLEFERERTSALRDQIEELVLEEERSRVDREALARLEPGDAELVRELLGDGDQFATGDEEDEEDAFPDEDVSEDDDDGGAEEIARLLGEIDVSRARQAALERFVRALEQPSTPPSDT